MAKKVLVVDDNPDVRLFTITVIEENGYIPVEAEDGEEGMRLALQEKPDLLILDVLMPMESGIRMYRRLLGDESLKHIPVIVVSGIAHKTFLKSQKVLAEFGGGKVPEPFAYLEKPVDAETLSQVINSALG